jgi:hypothetical protein
MKRNFIFYPLPELKKIESNGSRFYLVPNNFRYPSITTILGSETKEHIDKWRQTVGNEVADNISKLAAARGTRVHKNMELYLQGKQPVFPMFDVEERKIFNCFLPVLDSITEIHAMETELFSHKLQCAGTVDLICRNTSGDLFILDWKTSSRYKTRDEIHHYFAQCAAYAFMFYEMTGVAISKICIQMATEEFGLITFNEDVKTWLPTFIEIRNKFRIQTGL